MAAGENDDRYAQVRRRHPQNHIEAVGFWHAPAENQAVGPADAEGLQEPVSGSEAFGIDSFSAEKAFERAPNGFLVVDDRHHLFGVAHGTNLQPGSQDFY
jgi:hypothetical protein